MANTKKPVSKTAQKEPKVAPPVEKPVAKEAQHDTKPTPARSLKQVPLTDLVCVKSCFYGTLVYVSRKTGSVVEWNEFDTEQYMSVEELLTMRNTQPTFFKESWVRLVGDNADDVFVFLQLDRYCKGAIPCDNFREIFDMESPDIKRIVSSFTPSLKESIARYASELIQNGELNAIDKVRAIEGETGYKLMD